MTGAFTWSGQRGGRRRPVHVGATVVDSKSAVAAAATHTIISRSGQSSISCHRRRLNQAREGSRRGVRTTGRSIDPPPGRRRHRPTTQRTCVVARGLASSPKFAGYRVRPTPKRTCAQAQAFFTSISIDRSSITSIRKPRPADRGASEPLNPRFSHRGRPSTFILSSICFLFDV